MVKQLHIINDYAIDLWLEQYVEHSCHWDEYVVTAHYGGSTT